MEKSTIKMENKKSKCCGCAICASACPKGAISMQKDEYGFIYPVIDEKLCITCGVCERVCNYRKESNLKMPRKVYAAAIKDDEILNSSSGGIFYAIARSILRDNGVVYGCAFEIVDGNLEVKHICVNDEKDLWRLQGSKYVQSSIEEVICEIENILKSGKKVLFSGTPCQVDGLLGYLGNRKYNNLYTVDIICHGVPNISFFRGYINKMEKRLRGKIESVCFRDKTKGWGLNGSIVYRNQKGKKRKKKMPTQGFSYYKMFLDSDIYRENCYSCKYATLSRVGDITLGDFWGIEKVHPEFMHEGDENFDIKKGISCVLINSEHGEKLLKKIETEVIIRESNAEKVIKYNQQLKLPSERSPRREQILMDFKKGGYLYVEQQYFKRFGIKSILYKMWDYIPGKIEKE